MYERKGADPFFFVPFSKLLFSFNQLPLQLEEKSNAFYKRMRILHMNNELYLNDEHVNDLCGNESIEQIIPYLLSLLPVMSIPRTAKSNKFVEALRQDSDSIHAFLSKYCVFEEGATVTKSQLYQEYTEFCIRAGRECHKKHGFMRNIRSLGMGEGRDKEMREACWIGIRLKKRKKQ